MKTLGLVIGLLCCGLATHAGDPRMPDRDRYGFFLTHNRNWTRIPFQLHSNLIVVPVRINDSDTLNFILDTGVGHTIITNPAGLSRKMMKMTRRINLMGAGEGSGIMATVAIDNTLKMGALQANHHNVVMLDEDVLKLSEYVGTPIHGIFGYEVFDNFVVNIDFQRREITLMKPEKYRYRKSQGDQLPIRIQDTKVYTDALTICDGEKSTPLRVVLDTGAGHALLLDQSHTANPLPLPEKVIRAQLGRGLSGVINGNLGRIGKIRFGRYELANILASFPDSIAYRAKLVDMPQRQGNVGCELLRRFNVTFNYRQQYMVMKPVRKIMREQFEHDMSGLELRAKGDEFRSYYVGHIADGSPAEKAGIHEGDEVLFINKSSAKDLTITDIYKILQEKEGREVSFVIRRSGQLFVTVFNLKRMI